MEFVARKQKIYFLYAPEIYYCSNFAQTREKKWKISYEIARIFIYITFPSK